MNISTQDKATDLGKVKYHLGKLDEDCQRDISRLQYRMDHLNEIAKIFEWSASNEKLDKIRLALQDASDALDRASEEAYSMKRELQFMLKYVGRE